MECMEHIREADRIRQDGYLWKPREPLSRTLIGMVQHHFLVDMLVGKHGAQHLHEQILFSAIALKVLVMLHVV